MESDHRRSAGSPGMKTCADPGVVTTSRSDPAPDTARPANGTSTWKFSAAAVRMPTSLSKRIAPTVTSPRAMLSTSVLNVVPGRWRSRNGRKHRLRTCSAASRSRVCTAVWPRNGGRDDVTVLSS